jgi:hypothetical protein
MATPRTPEILAMYAVFMRLVYPAKCAAAQQRYSDSGKKQSTNAARYRGEKEQVFTFYGRQCSRCGEADMRCLSIDHINGGGGAHRRKIGSHFYRWLIKHNFPSGFQTLCMNCQYIKRHENNEVRK